MNTSFWIMFALWAIMAYSAYSDRKENKTLRQERSELLKKNCDLRDEVHHLKVKYGEIPVTSWIMTETTIQKVGGINE